MIRYTELPTKLFQKRNASLTAIFIQSSKNQIERQNKQRNRNNMTIKNIGFLNSVEIVGVWLFRVYLVWQLIRTGGDVKTERDRVWSEEQKPEFAERDEIRRSS